MFLKKAKINQIYLIVMKELKTMTPQKKRQLLKSLILKELGGVKLSNNEQITEIQDSEKKLIIDNVYSITEINEILIKNISLILKIPEEKIEKDKDLGTYGIDSMGIMTLLREINNLFSIDIDSIQMVSFKNIKEISNFIFEVLKNQ